MDEREYNRRMEARKRVITQRRQEEKQKREFGVFAFAVVGLAIAILVVSIYILCYIREITVKDIQYSSKEEVIDWIQEDMVFSNSIVTYLKYKYTDVELPGQMQSVEVKLDNPWSLTVFVDEKEPVCGVLVGNVYVYCDMEGTVLLESASQKTELPLIEGIEVDDYTLYTTLPVDNQDIFTNVLEVTSILSTTDLEVSRIISGDGAKVTVVIDGIDVLLGNTNYQEKIAQLGPILAQLEGQKGKLDLENFSTTNSTVSFEIKKSEN